MARQGLRHALVSALHEAASQQQVVRRTGLRVKSNGDFTATDLTVRPMPARQVEGVPMYLVILAPGQANESGAQSQASQEPALESESDKIAVLQQELRAKDDDLRVASEELETSSAELKSYNEEMQSINEELQSTNEELETSQEELHSVNEELSTVNSELRANLTDLTRANNDLSNLLAGTGIATLFVDHQLRILRFTPAAIGIINLLPGDRGRPVSDLVSKLVGYDRLVQDIQTVLDTLVPHEVDVQAAEDRWYRLRIQPYRTLDNVIEGAVITFVDISEAVLARTALRNANNLLRLAVVVRDASDAITVHDRNGHILAWNPGAVRLYGWSEEAVGHSHRYHASQTRRGSSAATGPSRRGFAGRTGATSPSSGRTGAGAHG